MQTSKKIIFKSDNFHDEYDIDDIIIPSFYNGRIAFLYNQQIKNYGNLIENAEPAYNIFLKNEEISLKLIL
jgi:hypothetical protein